MSYLNDDNLNFNFIENQFFLSTNLIKYLRKVAIIQLKNVPLKNILNPKMSSNWNLKFKN